MEIDKLIALRSFAYHTTEGLNLPRIRRTRAIESTRRLFALAGRATDPWLRERRREGMQVSIEEQPVSIRDQRPLIPGAIAFEDGWDLARLVEFLNGFAFFWPGNATGPIPTGRGHFGRYAAEGADLVVLRVPMRALLEGNGERRILFTRVNSGSARSNRGAKAPRGEGTFRSAEAFVSRPGEVKEVVIEERATLPGEAEFARGFSGPWQRL